MAELAEEHADAIRSLGGEPIEVVGISTGALHIERQRAAVAAIPSSGRHTTNYRLDTPAAREFLGHYLTLP